MKGRDSIEELLEQCLRRLEAGEPLETVLAAFPEHAAELGPLIDVAVRLRRWQPPEISPTARTAVLRRALEARSPAPAQSIRAPRRPARRRLLQWAVALGVLILLFGAGAGYAQRSLPGDPLYVVKRGSERARLQLPSSPDRRSGFLLQLANRRVGEIVALHTAGRVPDEQLVDDLAQSYEQALAVITQAAPTIRRTLLSRFTDVVQEHEQILAMAARAAAPASRAILLRATGVCTHSLERARSLPTNPEAPAQSQPAETATAELTTTTLPASTATPEATLAPAETAATATAQTTPSATAAPAASATVRATAGATPQTATAITTPQTATAVATAQTPTAVATPQVPTAVATPQTPTTVPTREAATTVASPARATPTSPVIPAETATGEPPATPGGATPEDATTTAATTTP